MSLERQGDSTISFYIAPGEISPTGVLQCLEPPVEVGKVISWDLRYAVFLRKHPITTGRYAPNITGLPNQPQNELGITTDSSRNDVARTHLRLYPAYPGLLIENASDNARTGIYSAEGVRRELLLGRGEIVKIILHEQVVLGRDAEAPQLHPASYLGFRVVQDQDKQVCLVRLGVRVATSEVAHSNPVEQKTREEFVKEIIDAAGQSKNSGKLRVLNQLISLIASMAEECYQDDKKKCLRDLYEEVAVFAYRIPKQDKKRLDAVYHLMLILKNLTEL